MIRRLVLVLVGGILTPYSYAQSGSELADIANRHYLAEEWAEAAEKYRELAEQEPENASFILRLGTSLQRLGRYAEAVLVYERATEQAQAPPLRAAAFFQGAESLAASGDKERALDWLDEAVKAGFRPVERIENNAAFKDLPGSRFETVVEQAKRNTSPCEYSEEHRQFDFWLGDWEVYTPSGQKAGTNSIQKIERGCIIFENWTGASGTTGRSFNFYDKVGGKWHQLWVDDQGNVLRLQGTYADGVLDYRGETKGADGSITKERLRFFDQSPDRVRQLWEQSYDGGESWTVVFDGEYRKIGGSD